MAISTQRRRSAFTCKPARRCWSHGVNKEESCYIRNSPTTALWESTTRKAETITTLKMPRVACQIICSRDDEVGAMRINHSASRSEVEKGNKRICFRALV